jgi:hypothetical protein
MSQDPEPVLVIHGVANRNRQAFNDTVAALAEAVGGQWNFIPMFWGDLAAATEGINAVIPGLEAAEVRGLEAAPEVTPIEEMVMRELLALETSPGSVPQLVRTMDNRAAPLQEAFCRGLRAELAAGNEGVFGAAIRGDSGIEDAVRQQWDSLRWLPTIRDPEILDAIGRSAGLALRQAREAEPTEEVRSLFGNVGDWIASALDSAVGAVLGKVGGKLNAYLRKSLMPSLAEFLGDAFVYQSNQEGIQGRLWEKVGEGAPGWGESEDRPIRVIAHSLGGLIAFDAALASAPKQLWIRNFITLGSQPALFHVLHPRGGLPAYQPDPPAKVPLPPSIRRWLNLWDPLDVLAFSVAKVFVLASEKGPTDTQLQHQASDGLWTHSVYWTDPEVARLIAGELPL